MLLTRCGTCGRATARECPTHCPLWEAQHRLHERDPLGECEWVWLFPVMREQRAFAR